MRTIILDKEFFRLEGSDTPRYDNLVYWVCVYVDVANFGNFKALDFQVPMTIQYSREGQMSFAAESPIADQLFARKYPVDLFCPVQCTGLWNPIEYFIRVFGLYDYIDIDQSREPMSLMIWEKAKASFIQEPLLPSIFQNFAQRRASKIAATLHKLGRPFSIFCMPGWSCSRKARRLSPESRKALQAHGFIFLDRG